MNHLINLIIVIIVTIFVIIILPEAAYSMYLDKRKNGYSNWRFIFSKSFLFFFILFPFIVLFIHALIHRFIYWVLDFLDLKFSDTFTSDDSGLTYIYYLLLFYLTMAIVGRLFTLVYKDQDLD